MLSETIAKYADTPRAKLFWAVIGVVVLAQMAALYMLCRDQVSKAQTREAAIRLQRVALTDCLRDASNSTISSCARQASAGSANDGAGKQGIVLKAVYDPGSGRAQLNAVVPASFNYR